MDENSSLLYLKELKKSNSSVRKLRISQGAILITITLERIAFYSLAGNLVLFLNKNPFQWESYNSINTLFYFFGISYLFSFIGGLLADTVISRFKCILLSFLVYIVGYVFLPLLGNQTDPNDTNQVTLPKICKHSSNYTHMTGHDNDDQSLTKENCWGLIIGVLTLISIGSGPFRSNIAPFGADQVRGEGQQANLTFFNWYYWCVNVGSLIALLVITYVQQYHGFFDGYLSALVCLAVSAVVFLCGSCSYVYRPRTGSILKYLMKVLHEGCKRGKCHCCCNPKYSEVSNVIEEHPKSCLDYTKYSYGGSFPESTVDEVKKILKVICVFMTLIPYWMVYFQMETTFLIQGLHMNLHLPGSESNKTVSCSPQNSTDSDDDDPDKYQDKSPKMVAAWFSVVDIIFVIILIPVFDRIIYPCLAKRGRPMGFVLRVSIGMVIAASAVCVAGVVEFYRLQSVYRNQTEPCCRYIVEQKIGYTIYDAAEMSIMWQIPQYALIGLSEVFASIAALEFAYQMAPKSAKGLIMGLFYLFTGIGSFIGFASMSALKNVWFHPFDSGNINCRVPCTRENGGFVINKKCQLDYYFFFLGIVEFVGLIVFLLVVRLCNVQKEIKTVVNKKSSKQPASGVHSGQIESPASANQ